MSMSNALINALIGFVGSLAVGVLLQLTGRWLSGGKPKEPTRHAHIGEGSPGSTIDQSTNTEITLVQTKYEAQRAVAPSGSSTSDDDWGLFIAMVVAGLAASLAFLFLWPAAVGVAVGAALLVAVWSMQTWSTTRGSAGPRIHVASTAVLAGVAAVLVAWWTVFGGPAGRPGMAEIDDAVTASFPEFSDGLAARWGVIVRQPVEVLQAIGLGDVAGLMFGVVMLCAAELVVAGSLFQWWSFRNVGTGRTTAARAVRRAHAFLGRSAVWLWLTPGVLLVVALVAASGYGAEAIEWLQSRQTADLG